ncbi:DUF3995 domain-containing protein [Mesobacillus zeae]|uniref:DUF3995 domain-containing protein n=1 Tax=Mesobacillus zeae TaxID=1917180 RepID=A0A398B7T4_9BACI|nr:DUF3995 domain-containing protein [Mesobacillus zeae]RID85867.1 DUF3995 domain-containing protein [Mesobacillus zeae]
MNSETRIEKVANHKGVGPRFGVASNIWGYIASWALVPYAIFKTLWAFGVPFGETIEDMKTTMEANSDPVFSLMYQYGIDITAVLAVVAILLALSLVQPWGQRFPRWLILIPAWTGGILFTIFGGASVISVLFMGLGLKTAGNMGGMEPGVPDHLRRILHLGSYNVPGSSSLSN